MSHGPKCDAVFYAVSRTQKKQTTNRQYAEKTLPIRLGELEGEGCVNSGYRARRDESRPSSDTLNRNPSSSRPDEIPS